MVHIIMFSVELKMDSSFAPCSSALFSCAFKSVMSLKMARTPCVRFPDKYAGGDRSAAGHGSCDTGCMSDINNDGLVNTADLIAFLGLFGQDC